MTVSMEYSVSVWVFHSAKVLQSINSPGDGNMTLEQIKIESGMESVYELLTETIFIFEYHLTQ